MSTSSRLRKTVPFGALLVLFACSTDDRGPLRATLPGPNLEDAGSRLPEARCEAEGSLRECAVRIGERGEWVSCMRGMQACHDGVWGPCGRESITFVTRRLATSSHAGGPTGALQGTEPPSSCTAEPCNPECLAFDEKPVSPISSPYLPGFTYEGNPNEWGNAPQGFVNKQNCGDHGPGCLSGYPKDCSGDPQHYNRFDGCQADHRCDEATDKCIRNMPGWKWPESVCPGVDLSIGPSCSNGTDVGFPLCNRGNSDLPAGTSIRISIRNGNSYDFTCPRINGGQACNVKTTAPLRPGECMRVVRGPSCNWSGNTVAYVNSDKAVAECGISQAIQSATQPGCSNNWSDVTSGAICQTFTEYNFDPTVIEDEYTAVCPSGTLPTWNLLVFEAMTPCSPGDCDGTNASSVQFEMQTASSTAPDDFTNWVTVAHAPSPPYSHPSSCGSAGPSPCPVSLASVLPEPRHEHLRLRVTLTPSPDGQAGSSLANWQITYNCGANE